VASGTAEEKKKVSLRVFSTFSLFLTRSERQSDQTTRNNESQHLELTVAFLCKLRDFYTRVERIGSAELSIAPTDLVVINNCKFLIR
jgi:hypothetical protein